MKPLLIRMNDRDNVAIVANDGGLPAGTVLPSGLTLVDKVPQGHKVALVDLAAGDAVRRYNVVIGRALRAIAAGRQATAMAAKKPDDLAGAYVAKSSDGQPQGLTLERLRLRFENNVYSAAPGQGWFKWGPSWARNKTLAGVDEFQMELGIDAGGAVLNPEFADPLQLDFRLSAESMRRCQDSYPQGTIPGVRLGVLR